MSEINTTEWRIVRSGFDWEVQRKTLQTKKTLFGKEKSYYKWETYYTGTERNANSVFQVVTGMGGVVRNVQE